MSDGPAIPMISSMVILNGEDLISDNAVSSQMRPLKSRGQVQVNAPRVLVHVPPLLHGASRHSSISRSHISPTT